MSKEEELREKIATLTRIFAMRGLLGIHGHISAYDPDADRMYICPGFGWDKANTRAEDLFVFNVKGDLLEGEGRRLGDGWSGSCGGSGVSRSGPTRDDPHRRHRRDVVRAVTRLVAADDGMLRS